MDIECVKCGWSGGTDECVCSKEDEKSDKPTTQIKFNRCPRCGGDDFEDLDDDEDDES